MNDYDVIPELRYLKPLRFKKYSMIRRLFANSVISFSMLFLRPRKGLKMKKYKIRGYKHHIIKVIVFSHIKKDQKAPGLLYIHGGGFQMGGTPVHIRMLMNIIAETGQTAVFVKYRLLPNHPFPAALYDAYHALQWMKAHADFLRIDGSNLSVMGDSAGGNLSIGVSLLSKNQD
ncbi:MAG: alpha/beta hydrolase, partial [Tenericutes bacterium]|nr:alpha/beta hydrolase [Mycoplasmatota bacterium]